MAGNFTPTPNERQFLRAIAAGNPSARRGEESWWSPDGLRITALFPDFRNTAKLTLVSLGRSCARKGLAVSRRIGTRGHGWTEYQVSSYGRGQVADSCIGGGLAWVTNGTGEPACPACQVSANALGLVFPPPPEIPVHALPGYAPVTAAAGKAHHG